MEQKFDLTVVNFLFQVWPDYPNVTVDESLDWETQVEVHFSIFFVLFNEQPKILHFILHYLVLFSHKFSSY